MTRSVARVASAAVASNMAAGANVAHGSRVLGRTGARVSELGFGAWPIGGDRFEWSYGATDDRTSMRAVAAALDHGCNFFDTADWYGQGHSETLLGKGLRSRRHEIVLATKGGLDFYHGETRRNFEPAYLRFALHQSLRRLRTDYVDVYQLHNPPPEYLRRHDVVAELEALRSAGYIRWIGVSAESPAEAVLAVEAAWLDTIQVTYNFLAPEAAVTLFPLAAAHGVGIIAREPLANGFLTGKYGPSSRFQDGDFRGLAHFDPTRQQIEQVLATMRRYCREGESLAQFALRFALEPREVSVVICGCKNAAQVEENFSRPGHYERSAFT
jgi:aryl-alcohol dehydrogenase-like predicted oxidoreductase